MYIYKDFFKTQPIIETNFNTFKGNLKKQIYQKKQSKCNVELLLLLLFKKNAEIGFQKTEGSVTASNAY